MSEELDLEEGEEEKMEFPALPIDSEPIRLLNALIDQKHQELLFSYSFIRMYAKEIPEFLELMDARTYGEQNRRNPGPGYKPHPKTQTIMEPRTALWQYRIKDVADSAQQILRLTEEIAELTRVKLKLFNDVDFPGGEYYHRRLRGEMVHPSES